MNKQIKKVPHGRNPETAYNKEIYADVAYASGMSRQDVKDAMRGFIKVIADSFVSGRTVSLVGFGKFTTKLRPGRTVTLKNRWTGKPFVSVQPPKLYVKFIACTKLRERMNTAKSTSPYMPTKYVEQKD